MVSIGSFTDKDNSDEILCDHIRGNKIQFIDSKPDLTGAIMADVVFLGRVDTGQADTFHPVSPKGSKIYGWGSGRRIRLER